MYKFGYTSSTNLSTVHPKLQKIFNEVIKHYDCSIIKGHRNQQEQDEAFHSKRSKLRWPESKHNKVPSEAVDVVPYPIDWNDTKRFYHFAGFVLGIAVSMGIRLRHGGDWDGDNNLNDQSFNDLPHFELHPDELKDDMVKYNQEVLPAEPSDSDIHDKLKQVEDSTNT